MPEFTILGDPGAIRARAAGMRAKGDKFLGTAQALGEVSTGGWSGRAADHFREAFETEPRRWYDAGDGFVRGAWSLEVYADAVAAAQARAAWAEGEYARGEELTVQARAAYEADVARARREVAEAAAGGQLMTLTILPFEDPGEAVRAGAVAEFAAASAELESAAQVCADGVRAGCAAAPEERSWLESGLAAVGGFFAGAGEATWDLLTLPGSPISLLSDGLDLASGHLTAEEMAVKYRLKVETVGEMAEALAEDPVGFGENLGKALVDWDTWADDPARALGHLVPDAVAAVLTAGAGAVATRGAKGAADVADAAGDLASTGRGLDELENLDDLGGLSRADNIDALHRYDDVPQAPQGTWRHADDPELEPWLDEVTASHPELSREGVRGTYDYTTDDGYHRMNSEMRAPQVGDEAAAVRDRIARTNEGLDHLPHYEGTTFRGTNLPDSVVDSIGRTGTYVDQAFTSSSLNRHVMDAFIDPAGPNPTRLIMEGHSGVDVSPFSAARGEAEILFRGGTEFEVLDNTIKADGVRELVLREVRP
ncbi:MAG: putative T7SS-secreted protein [Nocardioidaceae bacterium]